MTLTRETIQASQQVVIETFKGFRNELMRAYGRIEHESKEDGSPVTELDVRVELAIKQRLQADFPGVGFHGEETEDIVGTENALWIVDPIDGTRSFTHGLPYCSNMAALVVNGITEAAVIYHFATDELFTAVRGEGAYKNGVRIRIKNTELNDSIVFATPFVYKHMYHIFGPHKMGVFAPIGASGYEYTRLAQGSIQAVTKLVSKAAMHDNAPGVLLVQEAGAELVPFEKGEYTYEMLSFVVATPNVAQVIRDNHDEIEAIITKQVMV